MRLSLTLLALYGGGSSAGIAAECAFSSEPGFVGCAGAGPCWASAVFLEKGFVVWNFMSSTQALTGE